MFRTHQKGAPTRQTRAFCMGAAQCADRVYLYPDRKGTAASGATPIAESLCDDAAVRRAVAAGDRAGEPDGQFHQGVGQRG